MLNTKLENLMFARFSLMFSCFGKGVCFLCAIVHWKHVTGFLFNTCSQLRGGLESWKKFCSFEVYWDDCRQWLFRQLECMDSKMTISP